VREHVSDVCASCSLPPAPSLPPQNPHVERRVAQVGGVGERYRVGDARHQQQRAQAAQGLAEGGGQADEVVLRVWGEGGVRLVAVV
jgi:hypothetical protein